MYDAKTLSGNIRYFRKLSGMTQNDLAAALFVTAQNISKWELGQSAPDISNLCRLVEVFGITVDRLLGTESHGDGSERFVAIDGGGTKTEFILFTKEGEVLERFIGGGTNPNAYGVDAAINELRRGLDAISAGEIGVSAIFGGIAGCGSAEMARNMTARLKKLYPVSQITLTSDIENVISAAECGEDAIAVIAGTGSSVFAKCGGVLHRFGGWGYLYDRSYSGYDLGRDAIRATLAAEEGSGKRTRLCELIEARLGYRPTEALSRLYTMSTSDVAALASGVLEAYDVGDEVAAEIISSAVSTLAHHLKTATAQYPTCRRIIISGGLASRRDVLTGMLARHGIDGIGFVDLPQVYGAAVGCIGGVSDFTKEFTQKFMTTYNSVKL